jgi:fatty-acyl-CoA synthase
MIELAPGERTLAHFFAAACARWADRVAVRFGEETWTYRDLRVMAERLGASLARNGVRKGTHVALVMTNRPEWITSAFGVWLAGGVLVPLSTFARGGELCAMLAHSDAELVLTQRRIAGRDIAQEIAPSGLPTFALGTRSWRALLERGELVRPPVAPEDDALILYTSGTTADPKAIVHRHAAPVAQSLHFTEYLELGPDDRMWTMQPFFWAAGMAVSLGATLAAGARLVLQETFDAAAALEAIERERVTVIRAWPHQERAMAEHPGAQRRDLTSVQKLNAGSPLAPLCGRTADDWGTQGGYGLSETFTVVSDLPARAPAAQRRSTSGRPLPGVELRIVEGEILVKAPTMMRGYYKRPPGSHLDADGFFHTQDAGFVDEAGFLHWTGRLSTLIKTGGANVSPLEIERALSGYPGVKVAAALGIPHRDLGEEVVLCIAPSGDIPLDGGAIRRFLAERVAPYKVPRRVLFFEATEIPYTGTDKIRTAVLREAVLKKVRGDHP